MNPRGFTPSFLENNFAEKRPLCLLKMRDAVEHEGLNAAKRTSDVDCI